VAAILQIRARLTVQGWDHGTRIELVRWCGPGRVDRTDVPSAWTTLARILSSTGIADCAPAETSIDSSRIRFARSYAVELWQLDAFEYRLADWHR
jgi:hypothetical protein